VATWNASRLEISQNLFLKRVQRFLAREIRILALRWRSIILNASQSGWKEGKSTNPSLVEVIIPFPGDGRVSESKHKYYLRNLKKLLRHDLPRQTHTHFIATVFCDGESSAIRALIDQLGDLRMRYKFTDGQESNWGHVQTRIGILETDADFIVRMNCDNKPFPEYLSALLSGFTPNVDATYGRVIYSGPAAREHLPTFLDYPNELEAFILPKDQAGRLEFRNIDCMNYMVRSAAAKKNAMCWGQSFTADWDFINAFQKNEQEAVFVNRIIGYKC